MFLGEKDLALPLCTEGAVCGLGGLVLGRGWQPSQLWVRNCLLRIACPAVKRKFLRDCPNSGAGVVLEIVVQL